MKINLNNILLRLKNRYLLYNYIYPFAKRNINRVINSDNTVCLFSQPRGGSTWLAELILSIEQSCLIDEPLWRGRIKSINDMPPKDVRKIPKVSELGFFYFQPLNEFDQYPEIKELMLDIIKGMVPQLGLYNEIDLTKLYTANYYIVKFNYGQLLMHWLLSNIKTKAILFVRHPCATVNSQLNFPAFNEFEINSNDNSSPGFLNDELLTKYKHLYNNFTTREEWLAFLWAIQVKYSLYHPDNNKLWLTVSYEKLILDFDEEIIRIFNYLDKKVPGDIHNKHYHPSKSTNFESIKDIKSKTQISAWKSALTKVQIKNILSVVSAVGVNLYSDALEPDYDILYKCHKNP